MPTIFLSHSHKDKHFVNRLARDLRCKGVECWVDEAQLRVGDSLIDKISTALDSVDFVGAIISKNSVASNWVRKELDLAVHRELGGGRLRILPIVIDDAEIPPFLADKYYANFQDDYVDGLERLLRSLSVGATTAEHLPLLRSVEIPCAAPSYDQQPVIATSEESIAIAWPEFVDDTEIVFIYEFSRPFFELKNTLRYAIDRSLYDYQLRYVGDRLKLIAVVGRDLSGAEILLFNDHQESSDSKKRLTAIPDAMEILLEDVVLAYRADQGLTIERFDLDGRDSSRLLVGEADGKVDAITEVDGSLFLVCGTTEGLEILVINSDLTAVNRKQFVVEGVAKGPGQGIYVYHNCFAPIGDGCYLTYARYGPESSAVELVHLSVEGEVLGVWQVVDGIRGKKRVFKPSVAAGEGGLVVSWNEEGKARSYVRLDCRAFSTPELAPIWAYPRTLTRGPNYSTGIPMIVRDGRVFAAYSESSHDSFKVKLTEIELVDTEESETSDQAAV